MTDRKRVTSLSIQVLPMVEDYLSVVDKAIKVIQASGVKHEVGPMETTLEGPLDDLIAVAKAAHLACLEVGATRVMTIIKIADDLDGPSMDERTAPYRDAR